MMIPTIHLNGTSRDVLAAALEEAGSRLHDARDALAKTAPNGRDYYPQGARAGRDAISWALDEHWARMHSLQAIIDQIAALHAGVLGDQPEGQPSPQ